MSSEVIRARRGVEAAAAACYAGSFAVWTLGWEYKLFEPGFDPAYAISSCCYGVARYAVSSLLEAFCLSLLGLAVCSTVAAVRLRLASRSGS